MKKIYHQLEIEQWKRLLEILEKYRIEKLKWYLSKNDNKKLPLNFQKDMLKIGLEPEIGKLKLETKKDLGVRKLLDEVSLSTIDKMYDKIKFFDNVGIESVAYTPKKVNALIVKSIGSKINNVDYFSKLRGKLISSTRNLLTDGRCFRSDGSTIVRDYNFIVYFEENHYLNHDKILYSHAVVDNFAFDNDLLSLVSNALVRKRQ